MLPYSNIASCVTPAGPNAKDFGSTVIQAEKKRGCNDEMTNFLSLKAYRLERFYREHQLLSVRHACLLATMYCVCIQERIPSVIRYTKQRVVAARRQTAAQHACLGG